MPSIGNPLNPAATSDATGGTRLLHGIRVLVVEDNADVREMIASVLATAGADVVTVDSAEHALEAIHDQPPQVMLCDLHMPGTDGFELIHQVRSWERLVSPNQKIRAAAVSAYAEIGQRLRHARDEFQAFLGKPIDPDDLVRTVLALYNQPQI
jgi:CheY-like chemotaxis protein